MTYPSYGRPNKPRHLELDLRRLQNRVPPASFTALQIGFMPAFPCARNLEEWPWLKFTVRADHHSQLIGCGPKYNQWHTQLQGTKWSNSRKAPSPDRLRFPAAGPLGSPFVIHQPSIFTENQRSTTDFEVTLTPETSSSLPDVWIPVTQEDPGNLETINHNSDTTPAISGQIPTAKPDANEGMVEADTTAERAWHLRSEEGSETSDGEFYASYDGIRAGLELGTWMTGITKADTDQNTENAR